MPRKKATAPETAPVEQSQPTPAVGLNAEQIAAIVAAVTAASSSNQDSLARALADAINMAKPKEKVSAAARKPKTPWTPKDGKAKLKLKRKMHQHGLLMDEDFLTNEQIALMNKLRPGSYLNGHVKITRRKDRGIDIDYPIKTAAQRLRLVNMFGIRNLDDLLERCVYEGENPVSNPVDADGDLI